MTLIGRSPGMTVLGTPERQDDRRVQQRIAVRQRRNRDPRAADSPFGWCSGSATAKGQSEASVHVPAGGDQSTVVLVL